MKEITEKDRAQIEVSVEEQEIKEMTIIGSDRIQKGLTLFEYNMKTNKIERAEFEKEDVHFTPDKKTHLEHRRKIVVKKDCLYVQAMNKKNVIKKLLKLSTS